MSLSGLLIASDPLSTVTPVETLARPTWSLKQKRKGCICSPSYCPASTPGTLSKTWKGEETDTSNYSRTTLLPAFGAGRHSDGPCLCLTPAREGKWGLTVPGNSIRGVKQPCVPGTPGKKHRGELPPSMPTLKSKWIDIQLATLSSSSSFILTTHKASLKREQGF